MLKRVNGALDKYFLEYENDPDFLAEGMALAIVEDALSIMESKGLSRSDLANRMGVSRAHISQLFNEHPNLTLRTIAQLAVALEVKPFVFLDSGTRLGRRDSAKFD